MGRPAINLAGRRYGRLIVVERAASATLYARWRCVCDCGTARVVDSAALRNGYTKSCGCLRRETARETGRRSAAHFAAAGKKAHRVEDAFAEVFDGKRPRRPDQEHVPAFRDSALCSALGLRAVAPGAGRVHVLQDD